MPEIRGRAWKRRHRAGILASLAAEVVFVSMVALAAKLMHEDPWKVVKVPAAFLLGPAAVRPPGFVLGDVLFGAVAHVAFALIIGLAFARGLSRLRLSPLAGGLLTGALLYAFGFWILPRLFPQWLAPFLLAPAELSLQALSHLIYGLVLVLVYSHLLSSQPLDSGQSGGST